MERMAYVRMCACVYLCACACVCARMRACACVPLGPRWPLSALCQSGPLEGAVRQLTDALGKNH